MKRGRPLEYDREAALEAAMLLFWKKGFQDTSLKNLLLTTKISRSCFYYGFGSKYQLFELCIERYRDRQVTQMMAELKQATSGRSFIEAFLYDIARTARPAEQEYGCFVMNTAIEFAGRNPEVSILVSNATKSFIEVLRLAVERGQAEGGIPKHKNPQALAFYLMSNILGLRSMIKMKVDLEKVTNIVNTTVSVLD